MRADKEKIEMVMARKCMNISAIVKASGMPAPSVKNVMYGRGVNPYTLGKFCKALGVDPAEIIAKED